MSDLPGTIAGNDRKERHEHEITTIVAPVAKAAATSAVAGFVLGTLIGWLFFPDAMKPWQFGMIFALVTLLLVLLAATPYVWRRYSGQS